ncbi:putative ferric-chelate reductase 1 homolog [Eurytemora carolleeae]|uniref:putative ferric-chelate reductase 1 homolog n=1 Tax=Eurytemora carolleeae TaxID=1294199 RepID=UPI000C767A11|nr:putative ferric-chelate reductase 1 homolog [Eurytemora carolleeae]|eukprot:XP_023326947.1 putative ferric-chelate reductase 1 homolog [Eurytemora affinis]
MSTHSYNPVTIDAKLMGMILNLFIKTGNMATIPELSTPKVLATVVKDFASFYVKVPSEPVTVGPPNPDAAATGEPEPESEPEPEPESEPESEPEPESEGVKSNSEAFVGCAQDKNCFGSPSGCENTKTCDYMFTWKLDGDKMVWEGYRKGSGYVAVGVSEDIEYT